MFDIVVKRLMQGEFVCQISDEAGFRFLQQAEHARQVDEFLQRLQYRLTKTQNGQAYYAAYREIDAEARQEIKKSFQQFRVQLQPVVEWLELMMDCLHSDSALSPGDTLSFGSLLHIIESNQALADRLQTFSRFKDFICTDDAVKSRLEKLLKTLDQWGYLHLSNRDTLIYQVTGKLDYYFQALQFIKEHEQLPIEQGEEDMAQASLF